MSCAFCFLYTKQDKIGKILFGEKRNATSSSQKKKGTMHRVSRPTLCRRRRRHTHTQRKKTRVCVCVCACVQSRRESACLAVAFGKMETAYVCYTHTHTHRKFLWRRQGFGRTGSATPPSSPNQTAPARCPLVRKKSSPIRKSFPTREPVARAMVLRWCSEREWTRP